MIKIPTGPRLTTTTSAATRTTLQALMASGAIRLLEVVPNPNLVIDNNDKLLITGLLTGGVAYAQNLIEDRVGSKILAAAETQTEVTVEVDPTTGAV